MTYLQRSRKSFTLLELMVAFIIMAILSAVAIPSLIGVVGNDQLSADNTSAISIVNAAFYNAESQISEASPTLTFPITASELAAFIPAGTDLSFAAASCTPAEGTYSDCLYGDPTPSIAFGFSDGDTIYIAAPQAAGDSSPTLLGGTSTSGGTEGGGAGTTTTTTAAPTTTTTLVAPFLAEVPVAFPQAVCSDGTDAWVTSSHGDDTTPGTVSEIDIATSAVVGTPATVGVAADTVSCYGGNVWVGGNYPDNTVTEISAGTGAVTNTYTLPGGEGGGGVEGIYADATGVWVTTQADVTLELDPTNGNILNTFDTGGGSQSVVGDGTDVWVTNSNTGTITEINEADASVVTSWVTPTGGAYSGIAVSGSDLWITDQFNNAVYEYTTSGTLLQTVTVPEAHTVAVYGNDVWVGTNSGDVAVEIDATTGDTLQTVSLPGQPLGSAADGSSVWFTAFNNDGYAVQLTP